MTKPMVLGLLVAIALFWAVGAYNRLVRLRSEVVKAYSALDNVLSVHPAVIKAAQPLADAGLARGLNVSGGMVRNQAVAKALNLHFEAWR